MTTGPAVPTLPWSDAATVWGWLRTAVAGYVGAPDADDTFVGEVTGEAAVLVVNFIGTAGVREPDGTGQGRVPYQVASRAIVEVASELFHRRNAPNGLAQFAGLEGAPVRVARDPMLGAYPLLTPFVGGGIG